MREKRTLQTSIFEQYAEHEIGQELKMMSAWLDDHTELLDWVAADITPNAVAPTGREGLSIESALRCALLKQYRQLSYDELVFCLLDSNSCQAFARLSNGWTPKKPTLQSAISAISATTWERINQQLLSHAAEVNVEKGKMLRIDSTVTDAPIHEPSDSTLLWDSVRVLVRLLEQAQELAGHRTKIEYRNHRRVAKKRMRAIKYTRGKEKKAKLYRDLIGVTNKSLSYLYQAQKQLTVCCNQIVDLTGWRAEVAHYEPLIRRVIDQTERRVFQGEKVPATEKIVSLFEEHTDIIVKGARDIQYGHKLNLSTGRSGLVLDVVIEQGNPADAERFLPMLDRHIEHYGKAPRQVAADGGYASKDNLDKAKALQIKDVVFHKKRGLHVEEMAKSPWVYRKLRNFRAGIEAGISTLKRAYGLKRCTWKGLEHFKAYIWSSVVAHNLALFGRLLPT
ncbi:MAG: ISNCY family transposase [Candidatus Thiodiazotropha taylori]|nr:ISNCY family transposase [Candidatus Thiodiazotropha taylori]MCW4285646.1 ISNCY family transposase [Candidatus Thiodiazotropha taylori]